MQSVRVGNGVFCPAGDVFAGSEWNIDTHQGRSIGFLEIKYLFMTVVPGVTCWIIEYKSCVQNERWVMRTCADGARRQAAGVQAAAAGPKIVAHIRPAHSSSAPARKHVAKYGPRRILGETASRSDVYGHWKCGSCMYVGCVGFSPWDTIIRLEQLGIIAAPRKRIHRSSCGWIFAICRFSTANGIVAVL